MIHKFSRFLMTLVALFTMTTGAWADDEYVEDVTKSTDVNNTWTFTMPNTNVELEIEYEDEVVIVSVGETPTETPYATLQEAFNAVKDGETIKLVWNVTLTGNLTTPNRGSAHINFTLDFNGYTVNAGTYGINLANGDIITLTDGTTGQMGGLKCGNITAVVGIGGQIIFAGGRYNFSDATAEGLKTNWGNLVSNSGWQMADGKEFVNLNGGEPDDDGFIVRVSYNTYKLIIGSHKYDTFYDNHNLKFDEGTAEGIAFCTISLRWTMSKLPSPCWQAALSRPTRHCSSIMALRPNRL
jgi:hypothetical protein